MNRGFLDAQKSILKKKYPKRYIRATRITHACQTLLNLFLGLISCLILSIFSKKSALIVNLLAVDCYLTILFIAACDIWIFDIYFRTRLCWLPQLFQWLIIFIHVNEIDCGEDLNVLKIVFLLTSLLVLFFLVYWHKHYEIRYSETHFLIDEMPIVERGDAILLVAIFLWRFPFVLIETIAAFDTGEVSPLCP